MAARLRNFVGHTAVEGLAHNACLIVYLSDGVKLQIKNGDNLAISVAGDREQIIDVYDKHGEELCQIPVRAGV
jgi:hypothetical protein